MYSDSGCQAIAVSAPLDGLRCSVNRCRLMQSSNADTKLKRVALSCSMRIVRHLFPDVLTPEARPRSGGVGWHAFHPVISFVHIKYRPHHASNSQAPKRVGTAQKSEHPVTQTRCCLRAQFVAAWQVCVFPGKNFLCSRCIPEE